MALLEEITYIGPGVITLRFTDYDSTFTTDCPESLIPLVKFLFDNHAIRNHGPIPMKWDTDNAKWEKRDAYSAPYLDFDWDVEFKYRDELASMKVVDA